MVSSASPPPAPLLDRVRGRPGPTSAHLAPAVQFPDLGEGPGRASRGGGDPRVLVAVWCCRNRAYVITRKCSVVTSGPGSVPPPSALASSPDWLSAFEDCAGVGGAGAEEVTEVTCAWYPPSHSSGDRGPGWGPASVSPSGPQFSLPVQWDQRSVLACPFVRSSGLGAAEGGQSLKADSGGAEREENVNTNKHLLKAYLGGVSLG